MLPGRLDQRGNVLHGADMAFRVRRPGCHEPLKFIGRPAVDMLRAGPLHVLVQQLAAGPVRGLDREIVQPLRQPFAHGPPLSVVSDEYQQVGADFLLAHRECVRDLGRCAPRCSRP